MADYVNARWDDAVQKRFWSKVVKGADSLSCWLWTGVLTPQGYGQFSVDNRHYAAHRLLKSKLSVVPERMVCDHLCRNRACVNPAHIEIVTNQENIRRGILGKLNSAKGASISHCRHGHEYTEETTRFTPRGTRTCRVCDRIRGSAYTAARVERNRRARAQSPEQLKGEGR